MTSVNRRQFLSHAALISGASVARPLESLFARWQRGSALTPVDLYGPLEPVKDETTGEALLQLPRGFRYLSTGWTGDSLDDGGRTPGAHDGMAAFAAAEGRVRLVRNHELTTGPAFARDCVYDTAAGGGTTTLEFDGEAGAWRGARASLGGTARNCAGGATPWGSWLTCEETTVGPGPGQPFTRPHGYVFEVPLEGRATCEPLTAMGRFVHEAVAVDPVTGIVYETEDQQSAGLYRFTPSVPRNLSAGGRLEMLAIADIKRADTRTRQRMGAEYPIEWVRISDPTRAHDDASLEDGRGVFTQGRTKGGAVFARLEGATWAGGKLFVTATNGGDADMGQVWELDPARARLRLVFESPGPDVLNMPDNLCVSPRGALVICEDGTRNPCVHALTAEGRIVRFVRNNVVLTGKTRGIAGDFRSREFAGATFSPDGRWLFLNIQSPGITVAITGPWQDGVL